MNSLKKMIYAVVLVVLTSMSASGCFFLVGAAAGAGGIIWARGKLTQELNASLEATYNASIKALKKMELPIIIDRKDKLTAKIESEFSDGARVWIDIKSLSARSSRIAIRVSHLGDEQRSRQILEMVERHL